MILDLAQEKMRPAKKFPAAHKHFFFSSCNLCDALSTAERPQKRVQKFEKGGAQFPVSVSTKDVGEDQKKGVHVFRRSIYPPKSKEDRKKKVNASSDVLFPLFR